LIYRSCCIVSTTDKDCIRFSEYSSSHSAKFWFSTSSSDISPTNFLRPSNGFSCRSLPEEMPQRSQSLLFRIALLLLEFLIVITLLLLKLLYRIALLLIVFLLLNLIILKSILPRIFPLVFLALKLRNIATSFIYYVRRRSIGMSDLPLCTGRSSFD